MSKRYPNEHQRRHKAHLPDAADMDEASYRSGVIQLFEKHRAEPGTPYDEDHFLDFLLINPKKRRAVYESFRGLRRYNAFIEDVQYEFAICFSMKDFDANYGLSRFVDRVSELKKSPRGSLTSLKNQTAAGSGWHVVLLGNLVLLLLAAWSKSNVWLIAALAGVAVLLNVWFVRFAWKAKTYRARLRSRIEAAGPDAR